MERVRVSAETAVQIIKNGGMLILTDDETRENEGDLVVASEFITAEHINFMAKYGKGLIWHSIYCFCGSKGRGNNGYFCL